MTEDKAFIETIAKFGEEPDYLGPEEFTKVWLEGYEARKELAQDIQEVGKAWVMQRGGMQKLGDVIGGLILLFVSAWAIVGGMKLHLGKVSEPQPGFFPFWGGVVLAVLCGILLFQARSGRSKGNEAVRGDPEADDHDHQPDRSTWPS